MFPLRRIKKRKIKSNIVKRALQKKKDDNNNKKKKTGKNEVARLEVKEKKTGITE